MPSKEPAPSDHEAKHKQSPQPPEIEGPATPERQITPAHTIQQARLAPGWLSPHDVLHVQRLIGNRAVVSLLHGTVQRQVQREDEQLVAPPDMVTAINFYLAHHAQYTPAMVKKIEQAMGVPVTGVMDDKFVQAVARWQKKNGKTKANGILDAGNLAILFPGGLAETKSQEEFVEAAKDVMEGGWAGKTKEKRGDALVAKVNQRLKAANVPEIKERVFEAMDTEGAVGEFDRTRWVMRLDPESLEAKSLDELEGADLADTVYHEARHAEQFFSIARMLAGKGKTASQIAAELTIPADIADKAVAAKLEKGSAEAIMAEGWYESMLGGENQAYRERLEEADALRTGFEVRDIYLGSENQ